MCELLYSHGQIPRALLNMNYLNFLFLGNNSLSGSLPSSIGPSLKNLDVSYNQLSGNFPSWASQNNLQLNLVANNFVINNSNNSITFSAGVPSTEHTLFPLLSTICLLCGGLWEP